MPIDLSTPYSQIASLMFYVFEISSKKKLIVKAIKAMIEVKIIMTVFTDSRAVSISFLTKKSGS